MVVAARLRLLIGALALAGCGKPVDDKVQCAAWSATDSSQARVWPQLRPGYVSPIPAENALPGGADWLNGPVMSTSLEAYLDHVSANAGTRVKAMVRADQPRDVHFSVYRLGWYGGAGARLVLDGATIHATPQPACPRDPRTAVVRCHWPVAFSFDVGSDWISGLYVVRLQTNGAQSAVPLVVTDDRPADLLVQVPVTTWQAYNSWGGESLYLDQSGMMPDGRALQVSFDRPYAVTDGGVTMLLREVYLARFLERYGYDATYTTNFDVAAGGWEGLFHRGTFISAGHDEYWPREERDAVEAARDLGVPILFMGANDAYWKIRVDGHDLRHPRSFTCYKVSDDPMHGRDQTGLYRKLGRPESGLIGEMYEGWLYKDFPWVIANEHHFMFEGTGLHDGDSLRLLVGDEYDHTFNECVPGNVRVGARSPVVNAYNLPRVAETMTYRAGSGALVFAAGTIGWAEGLGRPGSYDPRLERITANLIKAAIGVAVPDGVGTDPLPPLPAVHYAGGGLAVDTVAGGLNGVTSVAELPDGRLVATEPNLDRLIAIASDGRLSVLADGKTAFAPGGPGLRQPTAVVADATGNLFIADTGAHCIRRIGADSHHTRSTVAGHPGSAGFADGVADQARFSAPLGLAFDATRNQLIVADSGNHRVRVIDLSSGRVRTVAGGSAGNADGPGAAARFHGPTAVALATDGRIFVVSSGGASRISVIAPDTNQTVTTLVPGNNGFADGSGAEARLGAQGGALWSNGQLLVSDPANYLIRAVQPGADPASTRVVTLAGSMRFGQEDGDATAASFSLPLGLAAAADGSVLVADAYNGSIRVVH